jgi:phosphoenolpyruvate synthase/pyruvate phosphate dikinase
MHYLIPLTSSCREAVETIGGKAQMLAYLQQQGFQVPAGHCLPVSVYFEFINETGLDAFIAMELQRKDFSAMRWEEIWDVSLRIRNHFVACDWPVTLKQKLLDDLHRTADNWPATAVRSSAPGEDSCKQSFAGLHESRVMLHGAEAILEAIRVVWASLWSDGALLYRHELGLDPGKSAMAVIIQEMVVGKVSGVLFTKAPQNSTVMMVEAVWGLNQALVDGTIEPDRWQLSRVTGNVVEKHEVIHSVAMRPVSSGLELAPVEQAQHGQTPLDDSLCRTLYQAGSQLEDLLGTAVDIEWTQSEAGLHILQARPITSLLESRADDERLWYLSLHRSLENLEELQRELEQVILPGMDADADQMSAIDLSQLGNRELAEEHLRRSRVLDKWLQTYKEKCIPMAHGLRLFGEFYNDLIKPENPFEFVSLLHSEDLLAVQRNRQLCKIANVLREDPTVLERLKEGHEMSADSPLQLLIDDFTRRYSGINWVLKDSRELCGWLVKLAEQEDLVHEPKRAMTEECFLSNLAEEDRDYASRILLVAKASYLLRDNDNLYLGKVRAGVTAVEQEIRKRVDAGTGKELARLLSEEAGPDTLFSRYALQQEQEMSSRVLQVPRQLIGQPAGPGVGSGRARVLDGSSPFADFKRGDVLVCDAIEPNMTFLAPLAAAIIERRGGMLVHGAIIAREYGIPCVTGIPEATRVIQSGDRLSVDGYLGIVTIEHDDA